MAYGPAAWEYRYLVYIPGSHRADYGNRHVGLGNVPGQRALTCRKGAMTVFTASLWHRIQPSASSVTRINVFRSYALSWINGYYSQEDGFTGFARRPGSLSSALRSAT